MAERQISRPVATLPGCEEAIGYVFKDPALLQSALTHSSMAMTRSASNERLEFLGDSVLSLVVVDELFHTRPDYDEGMMTQVKSYVVSRAACARYSEELDLKRFLKLNRNIRNGQKLPLNILADAFESLIAAIYIDGGYETAREFVLRFLKPEIQRVIAGELQSSAKSDLQQLVQQGGGGTPIYRVLDEQGPEHARSFQIAVEIGGQRYPAAWGASKKLAESSAAQLALDALRQ
jgi:ribonuclease III